MNDLSTKDLNKIIDNVSNLISESKISDLENYALLLIDKYPNWDFSYNAFAMSQKESGNYADAAKYFSKAISINPSPNNNNNLGCLYKDTDEINKAELIFLDILKSDKNFYQAHYNLASIYYDTGEYDKAEIFFKDTLNIEVSYFPALLGLGNLFREKKNFSAALAYYNSALKINPNSHITYNERAILFSKNDNYVNAINDISKSLTLNPSDPLTYSIRATINLRENFFDKALLDFNKCLNLKNNFKKANHGIGIVYKSKGQISKAISFFEKELLLYPDDDESLFMIGDSYIMIGDFNKAIYYLEKALEIDPENKDYNTILAVQKKTSGEYDEAAKLFKKGGLDNWRENELSCLYLLNKNLDEFYSKLEQYSLVSQSSPLISSLYSHANYNFDYPNNYNFCKRPMDFIFKKNLNEIINNDNKFIKELIEDIKKMDSDNVGQLLLVNGEQSAGNIFLDSVKSFKMLHDILSDQLSQYREKYSHIAENYILNWPENSEIRGWYIKMKKGGHLNRHMHEDGWVSGTLYLNMPDVIGLSEGMIEFSLFNDQYPMNSKKELKTNILNIIKGDIILFPSSLFHRTIPFNSDDERLCIAFDLKPL